jgi:hypothetical protein
MAGRQSVAEPEFLLIGGKHANQWRNYMPWCLGGHVFHFFLNPPIALQKLNFYTLKFLIFLFLPCQTSNANSAQCEHAPFPLIWFFTKRGVGYRVCAKIWQIIILFLVNFWPNWNNLLI